MSTYSDHEQRLLDQQSGAALDRAFTPRLKTLAARVRANVTYGARAEPADDWQRNAHGYTVQLRYQRRSMTVDFWCGSAITREPTAEDVLECLLSDASSADQPFEQWAGEYGYDIDSRKAERIYRQVQRQTASVRRLLGPDYDKFLNAERD